MHSAVTISSSRPLWLWHHTSPIHVLEGPSVMPYPAVAYQYEASPGHWSVPCHVSLVAVAPVTDFQIFAFAFVIGATTNMSVPVSANPTSVNAYLQVHVQLTAGNQGSGGDGSNMSLGCSTVHATAKHTPRLIHLLVIERTPSSGCLN